MVPDPFALTLLTPMAEDTARRFGSVCLQEVPDCEVAWVCYFDLDDKAQVVKVPRDG